MFLVEFDGQFDVVDSMMVTFICFTARLALMCKCFKLGMFGMNAIAIDSLEKNSVTFLEMT